MRYSPTPAHGTPGRYRGGKSFEPCRCDDCSTKHSLDGEAYRARKRAEKAGLPPDTAQNAPVDRVVAAALDRPVCLRRHVELPGDVERAVRAELRNESTTPYAKSLAAAAIALAKEIDRNFGGIGMQSNASAVRQLSATLEALAKGTAVGGDEVDDELAAMRRRPTALPA